MKTFFFPQKHDNFYTIIHGKNIYSWMSGYGDVTDRRNIGLVFSRQEDAEVKLKLMKHIMFCADKYWIPEPWEMVWELSNDTSWLITFDDNCYYSFSIGYILPKSVPEDQIDLRMNLLNQMNDIMKNSQRTYTKEEREFILNSY